MPDKVFRDPNPAHVEMALYGLQWALGLEQSAATLIARVMEEFECSADDVRIAIQDAIRGHEIYDDGGWSDWLDDVDAWEQFKSQYAATLSVE